MSVRAAGIVIFRRMSQEIEYLLLQTSYGEHHWTPPKGHVDPGEDDLTTALRETQEEAGLTQNEFHLFKEWKKEIHYNVRGKPKSVVYWLGELKNPNQKVTLSDEHQDLKWLQIEEACKLAQYQEMQDVLRNCHQYLKYQVPIVYN